MEFKIIVPDMKETFGDLLFMGYDKEVYVYDREKKQRTDVLEARIYKLASSVQGGQIEVTVPARVELKEFDFMKPVEIVNPKITSSARANGDFANITWKILVDDVRLKAAPSQPINK